MTPQQNAPGHSRVLKTAPRLLAAGILALPLAEAEIEHELGDSVVSAWRFPADAGRTTASVTVLDPRDLMNRGVSDLSSALNQVPGVISLSTGGQAGAAGSLFVRGTTTAYSQVVVDGMRLSDSTVPLGNFLGGSRLDDLGRIEVLRGPQSALYGGEAIGGVIWLETARGEGDPGGSLRLEGGSFNSLSGYLSTEGKSGNFSWFAGAGHDSTANDVRRNDWDQGRAAFRFEWQATPDFVLGTTFRANDARYENPYDGGSLDHLDAALGTVYANLRVNESWRARFHAGLYRESYDSDSAFGNYGTDLTRTSVSTDHVFTLSPQHRILWGAFYEQTDFENTIGTAENRDRYGSYLGWEWTPDERFTANVVGRWEDYAAYGDEVTWRTGAAWRIPVIETTLRSGIGRAFRTPTYLDLFGSSFGVGNPNLRAESSIGWDLGLEKEWLPGHRVGLTWFSNAIEDRIRSSPAPPVNRPGTTRTGGVEASLDGSLGDGEWRYRLAWTYLDLSLADQPRNSGSASIDWRPTDKWMLGVGAFHVDERSWGGQPLDEAWVARIYGEYRISKGVRLTGRIENAFDTSWQYSRFPFSSPVNAPGFGAFSGIEIDW